VIIDTSALVAILEDEPEGPALLGLASRAATRRMSSASYVELSAVIDGRRNPVLSATMDATLRKMRVEIVPFTPAQALIARDAYRSFGRGSGHPARLNMGDCFSYALAKDLGEPLLFTGRDFALTDIELVVEPDRRKRLSEVIAAYSAASS
jgi:ribonuclease VapC